MARILFVDDDLDTLRLMNTAVVLFGHQALIASSGQEGIRVAMNEAPDLIMMDMLMYDMDGLAVIRCLQSNPSLSNIPIVMVSASAETDLAEKARAAGAKAYLQKPIELQRLQDTIQKYTNGEE
jgi:CheY-like chemotaxis protein